MTESATWDSYLWTFLPGLHGTDDLYDGLCSALPSSATKETINLPQKGKQNYRALNDWLGQKLDDQPSKPRVLVAESFSGPLALHYASKHPDQIAAVILGASFCDAPLNPGIALLPLRPLFMVKPPKKALSYFLAGDEATDAKLASLRSVIQQIPSGTLSKRIRAVLELDSAEAPTLTDLPILILQADQDNLIPWEAQQRLESRYPHAKVNWINSPHLIFQSHPNQCMKIMLEFIDSLPE